jgi:hypothetical protein
MGLCPPVKPEKIGGAGLRARHWVGLRHDLFELSVTADLRLAVTGH